MRKQTQRCNVDTAVTPDCVSLTCCRLMRVSGGVPSGDTGLMKTMFLWVSGLTPPGVCGATKAPACVVCAGGGPEGAMSPRFCRVKLRMAGLGLCRRWAAARGEAAGRRSRW